MKLIGRDLFATTIAGSLALTGSVLAAPAAAQDYPTEPIELIVPWPAGGGSDLSMRILAEAVSQRIPTSIVVVNMPGAGGATGTRAIASAEPDGYRVGMVGSGVVARQYTNPNANPISDLAPIVTATSDPAALTARPDLGFEGVQDFIEYAKANPGELRNANDQPGGFSHIAAAALMNELNLDFRMVPYQGYAPSVAAILSGEVDTTTVPPTEVIDQHEAGQLKILGVAADERHFVAPDVPTFKEQGYDFDVVSWRAVVAPQGLPEDRLAFLEEHFLAALEDPATQEQLRKAGFMPNVLDAEATAQMMQEYDESLYPILEDAGLVTARAK